MCFLPRFAPKTSYLDGTNGDLKLAVCNDAACTAPTLTTVDSTGVVGQYTSLALNASGFPVISYYDITNRDLKVAVCNDAACTTSTLTTVDSTGVVGQYTSLALNASGFPVISYYDFTNYVLKLAVCNDAACTAPTLTIVDSAGNVGLYNSLALNASGFPIVSYLDGTNGDLKLATITPPSVESHTLPGTGFAPNVITSLPEQPANLAYADLDDLWLEIPSLNVSANIVGVPQADGNWDVTWLGNSAGWLAGSAFPTWAGNTVLTGHVWNADNTPGLFVNLKQLKYGDPIKIHAFGQVYTYEVRDSRRVSTSNVSSVMKHEKLDWLTLVTCEDYRFLWNTYSARRVARAVLISVK
jgi:LPXTG-site transpeptidase (sortase) family protein